MSNQSEASNHRVAAGRPHSKSIDFTVPCGNRCHPVILLVKLIVGTIIQIRFRLWCKGLHPQDPSRGVQGALPCSFGSLQAAWVDNTSKWPLVAYLYKLKV